MQLYSLANEYLRDRGAKMATAEIAEPINGTKLYQQRARAALPLLVRQAQAGTPIYYSDLASELGMSNARNLNFVLGSIGQTIQRLGKSWNETIPPIQCLVINMHTGLPGEGIAWFLDKRNKNGNLSSGVHRLLTLKNEFRKLSRRQQRALVDVELQQVYAYPKWHSVLQKLGLAPSNDDFSRLVRGAANFKGGGESDLHIRLKEYVARNPSAIGLPSGTPLGTTESRLPSGDALDVSFHGSRQWIGVEVKSSISSKEDLARGLFQIIKYRAVMEAVQSIEMQPQRVRALLAIEGKLTDELVRLKNMLGVEVIEEVKPSK